MNQLKKALAILFVLVMVFSMVACGKDTGTSNNTDGAATPDNSGSNAPDNSGSNTPDNSGNGTSDNSGASAKDLLTVAITQDRGTLDPMYMLGYDSLNGMRMVYETLWDIDGNGDMVWYLATGIEYVEPTIWHISLREGVTFQNGATFTAEDALFSILRGNNRVGEPSYLPELDMENSKVLDDYTVELIFHTYDLSYLAGMTSLFMFDVETFDEERIAMETNGTGPYEMTAYVINSHMDFTIRDGYWGKTPAIKNLHFIMLAEDAQRVNALQTGTADISGVPFQDIGYVETLDGITVRMMPTTATDCIFFNVSESSVFYNNPEARLAVAHAVDRQAIADIAFSGYAVESRAPVGVALSDFEDRFLDLGAYAIGYNPELARQYAESSGLINEEILLINPGISATVVECELIQAGLRDIGVTCNVQSLDAGSWLSYLFDPTMFDMCINATNVPSRTLAQNYYAWINFMSGCAFTEGPWPGKERFMELIDGIMAVSDPAEISDRYMELNNIHVEAMLWWSLVDTQTANAYNSDLKGYEPMLMGNVNYANLSW